jgi:hypothetical protein
MACHVGYLTAVFCFCFSVSRLYSVDSRMIDELVRIWKEVILALCRYYSEKMLKGTEEYRVKNLRILGVKTEIRTQISSECRDFSPLPIYTGSRPTISIRS